MDKQTQQDADNSNMVKDPKDWTTGDEPMTGARSRTLKPCLKKPRNRLTSR